MPEHEPEVPSLTKPPPEAPSNPTAKPNYVPFNFEEVPPRLPENDDFGRFFDATLRDYCDNLDTLQFHALTSNLIDSIVSRGATAGAYELWFLVEKSLRALEYLATGENPFAARHLSGAVMRAVERLNNHAGLNPELFQKTAQAQISWPVLHSPSRYFATDSRKVQKTLSVGSDYRLNVLGHGSKRKKPYDFTVPKNRLAWRVIETLTANMFSHLRFEAEAGIFDIGTVPAWVSECWKLKPFSSETVDEWARIGWQAILHAYEGKPENDRIMEGIGKHRAAKAKDPAPDVKSESWHSYVHQGIREELKEGLKKLARPHSPIAAPPPIQKPT